MSIITRYVVSSLLRYFAFVFTILSGIVMSVEFFEKIDNFMEAGLPLSRVAEFFALRFPFMAAQILPVALLLAVLFVFGVMNRAHEITAYRAGGGDPVNLLIPALLLGALASVLLFVFSEAVVPAAAKRANIIWLGEVKKELPRPGKESSDLWFSGHHTIVHITHYMPATQMAYGLTVTFFDAEYRLTRRLDAVSGFYDRDRWRLSDVLAQSFARAGDRADHTPQVFVRLPLTPRDLKEAAPRPEEMSFRDLSEHARRIEAEGYDAGRPRTDAAAKLAFPFVCLVMTALAGGLSIEGGGRESRGMAQNAVIGVALAFAYWAVHSLALSLGYAGLLPPPLSAWTANALLGTLAAFLFFRLREHL